MKVNIESLNVSLRQEREQLDQTDFHSIDVLEGDIHIHLNGGKYNNGVYVNTRQSVSVNQLSQNSYQSIINVIKEIQKEFEIE